MNELQTIVLGIVQGITEFLPISSTAHLVLIPWLFSWERSGLPFDVSLHVGSLFAIIYYFRRDWFCITRDFFRGLHDMSFRDNRHGTLALNIIVATIPAALSGLLFEKYAAGILRIPEIIAVFLIFFAIVLYLCDRKSSMEKTVFDLTVKDALVFGFSQALAIMPGVSRSGVTISGGLLRNYRRDEAARFSFLMGAPLIAGAAILESRYLGLATLLDTGFILGVLFSFITSFLAIKYLLRYVQTSSFTVFVIYRLVLGVFIILIFNLR